MDRSPALLVVHGIGTQRRGDTLAQCARGLLAVCVGAELLDGAGSVVDVVGIRAAGMDAVRLRQGGKEVRLYEVYWADLLPDAAVRHCFSKFDLEETTWFPLLNWRAGLLPREEYGAGLMAVRTAELWVLQVAMSFGLEILMGSERVRSTVLDQTAADVWNYVHSLGGDLAAGSKLTGVGEVVLDRFEQTWRRARAEGGAEAAVHVVAHSLGSVVAFHGLTRRLGPGAVERLVTIGSPLEKTRFLWAKLFQDTVSWPMEWVNFYTASDPVSGRLKRFDSGAGCAVTNRRLWGVGGLGEAHVGYFRDAEVMCALGSGLGVECAPGVRPGPGWWKRRVIDVAVPVGFVVLVVLGLLLTAAWFWLVIWGTGALMALPVRLFSKVWAVRFGHGWRVFWYWVMPVLLLFFMTRDGYRRAAEMHRRRWR